MSLANLAPMEEQG